MQPTMPLDAFASEFIMLGNVAYQSKDISEINFFSNGVTLVLPSIEGDSSSFAPRRVFFPTDSDEARALRETFDKPVEAVEAVTADEEKMTEMEELAAGLCDDLTQPIDIGQLETLTLAELQEFDTHRRSIAFAGLWPYIGFLSGKFHSWSPSEEDIELLRAHDLRFELKHRHENDELISVFDLVSSLSGEHVETNLVYEGTYRACFKFVPGSWVNRLSALFFVLEKKDSENIKLTETALRAQLLASFSKEVK